MVLVATAWLAALPTKILPVAKVFDILFDQMVEEAPVI